MMVHHDNPHRPFTSSSSSSSKYGGDGDVDVPPGTNGRFYSSGGAVNGGLGVGVGGGTTAESRPPQHPPFQTVVSSSSFSGMGCPFTQAQWRELERQAMIYKYMVASVPVPPNLLFPLPSLLGSHYSLAGGSYSLRFGNSGGDPEPGRCRRTDGKKWRCSRDAAPDQKYCERHLNRGRPRSRKPVEVSTASVSPNKKTRHCNGSNAPLTSTSSAAFNSATKPHGHHSSQAPLMFLHGNRGLEPVAVADNKDAKGLDWLMIGEPHRADETLSLNSNYSTTKADRFNEYLFPVNNSDMISLAESRTATPRGFIDAWSDNGSNQSCTVSPHGQKLSLSEETGHIHMGLGVSHWAPNSDGGSGSWIYPEPGGPLGEVFRPAINTVSSPLSPSSAALQGKMASVSDSSGGSSPTHGSSVGRSEMTLQWFNS